MPCRPFWLLLLAAVTAGSDAGLSRLAAARRLQHMAAVEGKVREDLVSSWVLLRHAALEASRAQAVKIGPGVLPFSPGAKGRQLLPLEPLEGLKQVAQRQGQLVVTWTTGGEFAKMALNLALSVRANVPALEKSLVVVCLDHEAQKQLETAGFGTVLLPGPDANAVKDPWQNDDLWKFKYRLMASLMALEISALVLDTDVVLLSDPFLHLMHDSDFEVMTDLFFPERQLLDMSLRPEDHFNTGYVYHRATPSALRLMMAFLDAFDLREWHGIKRDWFNQRAFNKLLLEYVNAGHLKVSYGAAAWCALRGRAVNVGAVISTSQRSCHERPPGAENITLRVLNPAVIAHGMNFFWRRAHLMPAETGGKALSAVHANGVEPKDYFLRDRGLWYLDDFAERFGAQPRFFTYVHPRGLSLAEDFEELAAALEVAMMLRRRMVLPKTMNCRNCPAFEPYGFAQWSEETGCTFDYFSRATLAMGEYLQFAAESHVVSLRSFQALRRRSVSTVAELQEELRAAGGRRPAELWAEAVVDVGPDLGIRSLRDLLKRAVGGTAMDSLSCAWRPWPATTYACRDAVFPFGNHGKKKGAPCDGSAQAECGVMPFMCCEAYFGWAEKLQLLGGKRWDLPCGCGLGTKFCEERHQEMEVCCSPKDPTARKKFGETCGRNPPVAALPRLVPDDSDTYSSSILRELAKGHLSRQDALSFCLTSAALHRGFVGEQARSYCEELTERFLAAQTSFSAVAM